MSLQGGAPTQAVTPAKTCKTPSLTNATLGRTDCWLALSPVNSPAQPKESAKFWRDPVLRDLEMLRATYVDYAFSRHAHEGYGIAIVESGAMEFEYRGATYVVPAGSVGIVQPGEMHTGHAVLDTGWTYRTLLPAVDWLQQAAQELTERSLNLPYFAAPIIHDRRLHQHLIALHQVLETSPSGLERESQFLWSMAKLVRHYASDRPTPARIGQEHQIVEQVRDYLVAHYAQNVSLKELANLVDLSLYDCSAPFASTPACHPMPTSITCGCSELSNYS